VIQLGKPDEPVSGKAVSLVGRTSLEEMLYVLGGSSLHMGVENGTVRLAKSLGIGSVVVYGPTSPDLFRLEGDRAVFADVCEPCFWKTRNWAITCHNDWDFACMRAVSPEQVADAVEERLADIGRA
jgi:ADP-heptose:LPS heptosyltransferase